ncbi:hypothetical protein V5799_018524 [Amblyomma americanum]|uniref:Uncharacterized protein n=1 Tax=Amblyomma americanum TaxID=6943 RepID=A0AAQ4EZU5_AMBAM
MFLVDNKNSRSWLLHGRREKRHVTRTPCVTFGDVNLSKRARYVLERRTKFPVESSLNAVDKVALVRQVANKASLEVLSRVIGERLDCIARERSTLSQSLRFTPTLKELKQNGLRLCQQTRREVLMSLTLDVWTKRILRTRKTFAAGDERQGSSSTCRVQIAYRHPGRVLLYPPRQLSTGRSCGCGRTRPPT